MAMFQDAVLAHHARVLAKVLIKFTIDQKLLGINIMNIAQNVENGEAHILIIRLCAGHVMVKGT